MLLVLQIGLLCLPSWVAAWSSGAADSIYDVSGLMARQQASAAPCRLNYTTDVWTGCDDVLAQFGISLDQFRLANPGIGAACDGYVPGKTYCVAACEPNTTVEPQVSGAMLIVSAVQTRVKTSTDGRCGAQANFTVTCVGSEWGDCCGSGG
jgi:hypothetical protein